MDKVKEPETFSPELFELMYGYKMHPGPYPLPDPPWIKALFTGPALPANSETIRDIEAKYLEELTGKRRTTMSSMVERPETEEQEAALKLRYDLCLPYVFDKHVYEFGCGTGHGTAHLADNGAKTVMAYDIKNVFREEYVRDNIAGWNDTPPLQTDIVVSVEVIEHLEVEDLKRRLLVWANVASEVVVTTPSGDMFPYDPKTKEERIGFHVKHYTYDELKAMFEEHYAKVEIYMAVWDPVIKRMTNYVVHGSNL